MPHSCVCDRLHPSLLSLSCVGIEEHQSSDIETYHCPNCQPEHGPLTREWLQDSVLDSLYSFSHLFLCDLLASFPGPT